MKKPRKVFIAFRVSPEVLDRVEQLAAAANLDRSTWAKAWLGYLSNLKREYAMRAMADIPQDRFKGVPGRPKTDTDHDVSKESGQV